MSEMTSLKVPKHVRDSIMRSARAEGLTAAEFLQRVTDEHARHQRFAAVRRAYAEGNRDSDYDEVTAAWDEAGEDGLADA
ncbi:hypothetical protein JOF29_006860 [Kribbella aluminosa]|uniref:Uncharacterized protein n=1 Tax=Kribbella aluminosa TaxID=416017 RepID=A0ABS4UVS2_9ACTN|nr:hypothetical protein [Kribbella aluminosa]MBP2355750.1 hypothetical protein [Kribbella aluminosa]